MPEAFRYERRVEFRDTDAAGIVHFSAYFTYMENAEHHFLRSIGLSVFDHDEHGSITWPRVSAKCDYTAVLRFDDLVRIEVRVARLGTKSVTYAFRFTLDGHTVATGEMVAVCCRIRDDAVPESMPVPDRIREKLLPYLVS